MDRGIDVIFRVARLLFRSAERVTSFSGSIKVHKERTHSI